MQWFSALAALDNPQGKGETSVPPSLSLSLRISFWLSPSPSPAPSGVMPDELRFEDVPPIPSLCLAWGLGLLTVGRLRP